MIELRSPTTLVTLDDDGMTCPGVMVQDVWDFKSRGTVISVTGEGITVLWSRKPIPARPPSMGSHNEHELITVALYNALSGGAHWQDHTEITRRVDDALDGLRRQGVLGRARCGAVCITAVMEGTGYMDISVAIDDTHPNHPNPQQYIGSPSTRDVNVRIPIP